jgi:hypothetical protein
LTSEDSPITLSMRLQTLLLSPSYHLVGSTIEELVSI